MTSFYVVQYRPGVLATTFGEVLHDGDTLAWWAALVLALALIVWHGLGLLVCVAARRWPRGNAS